MLLRRVVQLAELGDDVGKRASLDVLHRIVVNAPFTADRVNLDDVGVLQGGGGQRFVLEPLESLGVHHSGERKHFQGHSAVQGNLFRLVDDPHPAPANFVKQSEIAQPADRRTCRGIRRAVLPVQLRHHAAQHFHRVQAGRQFLFDLGVLFQKRFALGLSPLKQGRAVPLNLLDDLRVVDAARSL
jgi:hypothetical protein